MTICSGKRRVHGAASIGNGKEGWPLRAMDIERFVEEPGRKELVAEVRKKIDELGIEYLYLQFVSVTGRIMGKGIPADHWESVAEKGFQLVYGATMNLFLNRRGEYLGYGPGGGRAGRHSRARDLHAAALGQAGGAHVVHAVPQPRGAERAGRVSHRRRARQSPPHPRPVQEGPRPAAPARHRAGDDVAEEGRERPARTAATPIPIATTSTSSRACGPSICG